MTYLKSRKFFSNDFSYGSAEPIRLQVKGELDPTFGLLRLRDLAEQRN
jgi:hypothetical protein